MWLKIILSKSKNAVATLVFIVLTLANIIPYVDCLYEDQVGKFDW